MAAAMRDYYCEGLIHIEQTGGVERLPEVMTLGDVADYCAVPFAWLVQLRSAGALPGVCFGSVLLWRCHRQTVYEWMKEHANEPYTRMARTQRGDPPYSVSAYAHSGRTSGTAAPHPTA
jgi:hypothetical protein